MEEFSVKSERNNGVAVVTVTGRVDSVTAATLDSELAKIAHHDKKIVLDLFEVAYMSSAGVRAIVKALQGATKSGGGLKLAAVPRHVMDVLETVGMLQLLEIYPAAEDAAESF